MDICVSHIWKLNDEYVNSWYQQNGCDEMLLKWTLLYSWNALWVELANECCLHRVKNAVFEIGHKWKYVAFFGFFSIAFIPK